MVSQHGGGGVEELGDFIVAFVLECFFEKLRVVAPASFDEDLFDGGTL